MFNVLIITHEDAFYQDVYGSGVIQRAVNDLSETIVSHDTFIEELRAIDDKQNIGSWDLATAMAVYMVGFVVIKDFCKGGVIYSQIKQNGDFSMSFERLPINSEKVLIQILQADNPTKMLCDRLESLSKKELEEFLGILHELSQKGYIKIYWADDLPYQVFIHDSARTYNERLLEYEAQVQNTELSNKAVYNNSINIGNGNKI